MPRWSLFLALGLVIFVAVGCANTFEDPDAYEQFVEAEDSPYVRRVSREGVEVSARYLPTTAMLLSQIKEYRKRRARLRAGAVPSSKAHRQELETARRALEERRAAYDRSIYVRLIIEPEEEGEDLVFSRLRQGGFGAYSAWLRKLLFGLRGRTRLQTAGGEEVPPALFHMERTFGMSPGRTFLVAFPATFDGWDLRAESDLTLKIEEFGLGTGTLSIPLGTSTQARLAMTS